MWTAPVRSAPPMTASSRPGQGATQGFSPWRVEKTRASARQPPPHAWTAGSVLRALSSTLQWQYLPGLAQDFSIQMFQKFQRSEFFFFSTTPTSRFATPTTTTPPLPSLQPSARIPPRLSGIHPGRGRRCTAVVGGLQRAGRATALALVKRGRLLRRCHIRMHVLRIDDRPALFGTG